LDRIEPELLDSLEEHLYADGVAAVEWAERLPTGLRDGAIGLRFSQRANGRRVELETAEPRILDAARRA
jgi:tRNA A37 threonylcarbamoyladenosine biosynthesis protein TsaE